MEKDSESQLSQLSDAFNPPQSPFLEWGEGGGGVGVVTFWDEYSYCTDSTSKSQAHSQREFLFKICCKSETGWGICNLGSQPRGYVTMNHVKIHTGHGFQVSSKGMRATQRTMPLSSNGGQLKGWKSPEAAKHALWPQSAVCLNLLKAMTKFIRP